MVKVHMFMLVCTSTGTLLEFVTGDLARGCPMVDSCCMSSAVICSSYFSIVNVMLLSELTSANRLIQFS